MSDIVLLDGGLGQEIVRRSGDRPTPLWSTSVMIDEPGVVGGVHRDFFAAGATVATTNSYAIHRDRLEPAGLATRFQALLLMAADEAEKARAVSGFGRVAGSLGPLGASYRPDLCPPPDEAEKLYAEVAGILAPHVDFFICETVVSLVHAEGALRGAKTAGKPVWLALSVKDDDGTKLRSGEALSDIRAIVDAYGPEAVLINCSAPEAIGDALEIVKDFGLPFGAYANGFTKISEAFLESRPTVDALERRKDLGPQAYAEIAMGWVAQGATIVGGCCEVGPAHIKELARRLTAAGHRIV